MSHILTSVDELDLEISVAYIALGTVRDRFARCPSPENQQLVEVAGVELDDLLDQRLLVAELSSV